MNKKALTETDIRTKFITPAIVGAQGEKWNIMTQVQEQAEAAKKAASDLLEAAIYELTKI